VLFFGWRNRVINDQADPTSERCRTGEVKLTEIEFTTSLTFYG